MSEMIERIAKAIYGADDAWSIAFPWPNPSERQTSAAEYRRIARAAIEAMRDPTEKMICCGAVEYAMHSNTSRVFSSMIEAALKEKE